jgi:MFS family permease
VSISIARLESTDRAGCLAGLGGGGVLTRVMIITSDVVSLKERGIYQSISGVVVAASNSLGPLIGGAVTEKLSWRWCFVRFAVLPLTRDENLLTVKVH